MKTECKLFVGTHYTYIHDLTTIILTLFLLYSYYVASVASLGGYLAT